MAWSTPRSWTTGEIVTAAMMNSHVRDNLNETMVAKVMAAGDLAYATGPNALARLPMAAKGAILGVGGSNLPAWTTAPALNSDLPWGWVGGGPVWYPSNKTKTADEIVNNSTTLQNDDHLAWAIGINECWYFDWLLYFTIGSGDPNIKMAFTVPAGASGFLRCHVDESPDGVGTTTTVDVQSATITTTFNLGAAGTLTSVHLKGFVINGANAGTIQLQWAQNSAVASNLTLKLGSGGPIWRAF